MGSVLPEETLAAIEEEHLAGHSSTEIAKILDARGIPTVSGKPWNRATVGRICKRLEQTREDTYEDPAAMRFEDLVVLVCGECVPEEEDQEPVKFNRVKDLSHHTWANHDRLPTRAERTPTGELVGPVGRHKLTEDDVREIRRHLSEGVLLQREIAERYRVCSSVIYDIAHGRSWVNVQ